MRIDHLKPNVIVRGPILSAYSSDKKTLAYQLGEALSERTGHSRRESELRLVRFQASGLASSFSKGRRWLREREQSQLD